MLSGWNFKPAIPIRVGGGRRAWVTFAALLARAQQRAKSGEKDQVMNITSPRYWLAFVVGAFVVVAAGADAARSGSQDVAVVVMGAVVAAEGFRAWWGRIGGRRKVAAVRARPRRAGVVGSCEVAGSTEVGLRRRVAVIGRRAVCSAAGRPGRRPTPGCISQTRLSAGRRARANFAAIDGNGPDTRFVDCFHRRQRLLQLLELGWRRGGYRFVAGAVVAGYVSREHTARCGAAPVAAVRRRAGAGRRSAVLQVRLSCSAGYAVPAWCCRCQHRSQRFERQWSSQKVRRRRLLAPGRMAPRSSWTAA